MSMRNNNAFSNTLLMAWTLASAPLVIYLVTHGKIRLGVIAGAVAVGGLVLGSKTMQWAVVGAMAGATIGGVAGWGVAVSVRDDESTQAVFGVLVGGFVGMSVGMLSAAWLAQRTSAER
jgi:hypothetical protein